MKESQKFVKKAELPKFEKALSQYSSMIENGQTPYKFAQEVISFAKKHNYTEFNSKTTKKQKGFYLTNEDSTNVAVVKFGSEPLDSGFNISGAHMDSPCLTGKISPIRENSEGVSLDCYPYGGIYPHQWFDTKVTIIGHCFKNGKVSTFELAGVVSDATIHLSAEEKVQKHYKDAFVPETLDVFTGYETKKEFLAYMKKEHKIEENDFARTHIIVVPNTTPQKLGSNYFTAFGQDDKVCSFAQLHALEESNPKKTSITLFFDREEIGSTGYNGALSKFLEFVIDAVAQSYQTELSDVQMRRLFQKSLMISADVDAAYNSFDEPYSQKESASQFGHGICLDRFNGGRFQYSGNNASVQTVDYFMTLFDKKIAMHVGAIPPKVNTGGGGTIGMYFNHRGLPTVDMGIAVTNMHGKNPVMYIPDFYNMLKGFKIFFNR